MQPILKLNNIEKSFGGVVAAKNISLDVYSGKILGLIGPNGAGKTTLLNIINGIYTCDSGQIFFAGTDITYFPTHIRAKMGIARTFQSPRFLQRSNILDNMLLGMDLGEQVDFFQSFLGKKKRDFHEEISPLMNLLDFDVDWEDDISVLSYGRRKLLELVRALLSKPKVILVDEPVAGLNSKEMERVAAVLRYATEQKIGVVLIEHDIDMVMKLCDTIAVLNFGMMIAKGNAQEISKDPVVIEAYLGGDEP